MGHVAGAKNAVPSIQQSRAGAQQQQLPEAAPYLSEHVAADALHRGVRAPPTGQLLQQGVVYGKGGAGQLVCSGAADAQFRWGV